MVSRQTTRKLFNDVVFTAAVIHSRMIWRTMEFNGAEGI
jgi:hypothetical protein